MKEYLKNSNGKIKNCASNIAKMNNFEWIPIDEGVPIGSSRILVTLKNEFVCEAWYINRKFKFMEGKDLKEFSSDNAVVAWIALPKPYNSKEKTNG